MTVVLDKKASRIVLDQTRGVVGDIRYVGPNGVDATGVDGKTLSPPKATIAAAATLSHAGDAVYVSPGGYDESVTLETANLLLKTMGNRGAGFIEPDEEAENPEGMLVLADDITLENLGVAGGEGAEYCLKVGSQTVSPARFRAKGCKFEGAPVILQGAGDVIFENCEFTWEGAVHFAANDNGFCTQIRFIRCHFQNITAEVIKSLASGGVRNLVMDGCTFDNAEDGTAPTKFLDIDEAGDTGMVTNCSFALATNEAAKLAIAAGIKWVANKTEAGVSVARPA